MTKDQAKGTVILVLQEARRLLDERGWRPTGVHRGLREALSIVEAIGVAVRLHVKSPGDTQFVIDDAFREIGTTIQPEYRNSWINLIESYNTSAGTNAEGVLGTFDATIKRLQGTHLVAV